MNSGAAPLGGPYSSSINLVPTANPVPAAIAAASGIVPSFPGWEMPFGNGLVYLYTQSGVWTPPAFINGKPVTAARTRVLGAGGGGGGGFVSVGVYHPGAAGGSSSFSTLLTATGGAGGSNATTGAGGAGGIGSATAPFALLATGGSGGAPVSSTGGASFTGTYQPAAGNDIVITGPITGSIAAGQSISGPGLAAGSYVLSYSSATGIIVVYAPSPSGGFYSGTYTCLGVLGTNAGSGGGGGAGSQLGSGGAGGFSTTSCGSGGGGSPGQSNGWSPATAGGGGGASAVSSPIGEKIGGIDIFGITAAAGATAEATPTGTIFRFPTETYPSGGGGGATSVSTSPGNGGAFGGGGGGCFYAATSAVTGGNGGWGAGGGGGGSAAGAIGGAGGLGGGGGGAGTASGVAAAGGGGGGFAMATIQISNINYQITVGAAGLGYSTFGGPGGGGLVIVEI